MNLAVMFAVLGGLLVIGVPIAYSLGGAGIVYMLLRDPVFLLTVPQRVWSGTNNFIIIAMPLLHAGRRTDTGAVLLKRLMDFSPSLVRPYRGIGGGECHRLMIFGGIQALRRRYLRPGEHRNPHYGKAGYPLFRHRVTVASSTMGMIIPRAFPCSLSHDIRNLGGQALSGRIAPGGSHRADSIQPHLWNIEKKRLAP